MTIIRWLCFWPIAMLSGFLAMLLAMFIGGFLLGHWWVTGTFVVAVSLVVQPIVTAIVAGTLSPKRNYYVAWSIWTPYILLGISLFFSKPNLFLAYEAYLKSSNWFVAIPAKELKEALGGGMLFGCLGLLQLSDWFCSEKTSVESNPFAPTLRHPKNIFKKG